MKKNRAISFVFDDGYAKIMSDVLPMFEKLGFKVTVAVPVETELVSKKEMVPIGNILEWRSYCEKHGHELAAHGVSHVALTKLSDADLKNELAIAKDRTGAKTLIYPGGAFDERVKDEVKKYFLCARTTKRGYEQIPAIDAFELKTFNATKKNFRIWLWNLRALKVALLGGWLIETFHHVDRNDLMHSVDSKKLFNHLRFIKKLGIKNVTLGEITSEIK